MTAYIVLRRCEDDEGDGLASYEVVGNTTATSSTQAIRKLAANDGDYVAVPTRSFKEEPVTTVPQPAKVVVGKRVSKQTSLL